MIASRSTAALTAVTMLAFAANSLLCRMALSETSIDAATFTAARLGAGAAFLAMLWLWRRRPGRGASGSFAAAVFLFLYAAAFSFAYLRLPTGVGALILFGAVQLSMIGAGLLRGERLGARGSLGLIVAVAGLLGLTLPGATAPDPLGAVLMMISGGAWGFYSLLGKGVPDPVGATIGNFVRSVPLGLALWLGFRDGAPAPPDGLLLALTSGAVTSAGGYVLWYRALAGLRATDASIVQLSVPVLAAALGTLLLGEPVTLRLVAAGATILAGIAVALGVRRPPTGPAQPEGNAEIPPQR